MPSRLSSRDVASRLEVRLAVERTRRAGPRARGGGDFVLHHRLTVAAIIRLALRVSGIYQQGLASARQPIVRHNHVELARLPHRFDGFRILQLADLHLGEMPGYGEALAELVSGLPADVCVLTGDYRFDVHGPCEPVYEEMKQILGRIHTTHGVYGILGNHDCADMAVEFERMGVWMLVNEADEIRLGDESLWVAGVDDPHYFGCDDLSAAMRDLPADACKVLLAHSPEIYQEAEQAGVDLYLCGHTHGGQMCLPKRGAVWHQARCPRAYGSGAWRHGEMHGYTSAGLGCSLVAARYNCPPEITLITLKAG